MATGEIILSSEPGPQDSTRERMRLIERRDWWLWVCAISTTLLLTAGIVSFAFPLLRMRAAELNAFSFSLDDTIMGLVGMVLIFDIYTAYQHLQIQVVRKELVEREELFRLITENAADLIEVVDGNGRPLYRSPSYWILGYSEKDADQWTTLDHVHPEDRQKFLQAAAEALAGMCASIEYRVRHKDGGWRVLESKASRILSAGSVEKLVIVNRDVTERKHLEEQFRQSQKMEAVGRLSGGVAHDFNNLLGVIIGYGEVIQEGTPDNNPLRPCADEVLKAGHRAASLTRQLLAFSRQQVMDPRVLDLNGVVRDMEKMLKRLIGEDIQLKTRLEKDLSTIKADQGQIEQVILNLAVNARDAMPRGGELSIATSNFCMDANFVRRYPYPVSPGNYVLLGVSDNGIGMDATTRARAFEPFFTTKEKGKGTGLGLSTVYGVVKQSGGYIDVLSEPGAGATFNIYLPQVVEQSNSENPSGDSAKSQVGDETVLLVEDEASLRHLSCHQLELCGYQVLAAASGEEAIRLSEEYAGSIHLLLTDVVMPGMSGRILADQLVAKRNDLRVLYMSGYTGQTVGQHGVLAEGSFFLPKPFTRDTLARKVRQALDGTQASGRN